MNNNQIYIHDSIVNVTKDVNAKAISWTMRKIPADVNDAELIGVTTNAALGIMDGIFPSCIIVRGSKTDKFFRHSHGRGVVFVNGDCVSYVSNDGTAILNVRQAKTR